MQHKVGKTTVAVNQNQCYSDGLLAIQAAADPRVTALGLFNSGDHVIHNQGGVPIAPDVRAQTEARLKAVHSPTAIITGDAKLDHAHDGGFDTFTFTGKVPAIWAWQDGTTHIGSYGAINGGSFGRIASDWYKWQLKGDQQAARMFQGADCTLCREPTWHVQKKNMK